MAQFKVMKNTQKGRSLIEVLEVSDLTTDSSKYVKLIRQK